MSGKKNSLINQSNIVKSFNTYGSKIQNLKLAWSAYPADLRKAYCKVCNNTIIAKHYQLKTFGSGLFIPLRSAWATQKAITMQLSNSSADCAKKLFTPSQDAASL